MELTVFSNKIDWLQFSSDAVENLVGLAGSTDASILAVNVSN